MAGKCSPARHSTHVNSQEIPKKLSALWPRGELRPPPSQKCSPATRNLGRSSSNNASHLGQKYPTPPASGGSTSTSNPEEPLSPHAGCQGHSITLPSCKPHLAMPADSKQCLQGRLTSLGPCLPQFPPASRRSLTAWRLPSLLPWSRAKRNTWDGLGSGAERCGRLISPGRTKESPAGVLHWKGEISERDFVVKKL